MCQCRVSTNSIRNVGDTLLLIYWIMGKVETNQWSCSHWWCHQEHEYEIHEDLETTLLSFQLHVYNSLHNHNHNYYLKNSSLAPKRNKTWKELTQTGFVKGDPITSRFGKNELCWYKKPIHSLSIWQCLM